MKSIYLILIAFITLVSCKNEPQKEEEVAVDNTETESPSVSSNVLSGDYANADYSQRNEGYDWVGVRVKDLGNDNIHLAIRSRADLKKPTCTFDTDAYKVSEGKYQTTVQGNTVFFQFNDDKLSIAAENQDAANVLYFYCSGGATFAGDYSKIDGNFDPTQVDNTEFSKNLKFNDIGFYVTSKPKDGKMSVSISPFGPGMRTDILEQSIDGTVVDAETEDLNNDGFPEVVVYTKDNNGKGDVIAYSSNNNKSMSMAYLPPITDDPKNSEGYNGNDEFAIAEGTLVRRFTVEGSGKTRQIQYKLVNGENGRIFQVDKVTEY